MSNVQYEFKLVSSSELKRMRRLNKPDKELCKKIKQELKRRHEHTKTTKKTI